MSDGEEHKSLVKWAFRRVCPQIFGTGLRSRWFLSIRSDDEIREALFTFTALWGETVMCLESSAKILRGSVSAFRRDLLC